MSIRIINIYFLLSIIIITLTVAQLFSIMEINEGLSTLSPSTSNPIAYLFPPDPLLLPNDSNRIGSTSGLLSSLNNSANKPNY